jgi:mono/diheme cytochrome c family protein
MFRLALALTLCAITSARAADPVLERGEYLVERVGMCSDCHSPRDPSGQFIRSAWLGGAPIEVTPIHPVPGWARYAPQLAGLPAHYTEAALAAFLETGVRPDGFQAGAPMPPYRFSRPDAEAIVAYLRSLGPELPPSE